MKLVVAVSALVILGLFGGVHAPVRASGESECEHHAATIQSLRECVQHASMMGHIDNGGVANSLFAKLSAAQSAVDGGHQVVAVNILRAFISQVNAQAGQHIDAEHAEHMAAHAQQVIDSLNP